MTWTNAMTWNEWNRNESKKEIEVPFFYSITKYDNKNNQCCRGLQDCLETVRKKY